MASNFQTGARQVAPANFPSSFAFAEMAMRTATQMMAVQVNTFRALAETQARAAAAWGLPSAGDWLFNGSEQSVGQATLDTADQVISTFRRTAESVSQLQGHVRQLLAAQSGAANQQWQKLVERMGVQAAQSLDSVRAIVEEQSRRIVEETEARVEAIAVAMQEDVSASADAGVDADDDEVKGTRPHGQEANGSRSRASRQH